MPVIVLHNSIIVFMGSEWIVHSRCLVHSPRISTVSIVKYEIIHSILKIVLTCKVLLLGKYESVLVAVSFSLAYRRAPVKYILLNR